jgi:hypothetical protein
MDVPAVGRVVRIRMVRVGHELSFNGFTKENVRPIEWLQHRRRIKWKRAIRPASWLVAVMSGMPKAKPPQLVIDLCRALTEIAPSVRPVIGSRSTQYAISWACRCLISM